MKKLQGNSKQIEPLIRPNFEIASNFSDTKFLENQSKTFGRNSEGSNEQYLNCTASTSSNCELDGIKFQFNNSTFDLCDSESSINSDEEPCDEKIGVSEERAEEFNQTFECVGNGCSSFAQRSEAEIWLYEELKKLSKSDIHMEQSNSELLLRKTTRITDFNFAERGRNPLIENAGSWCDAEVLMTANKKKIAPNRFENSGAHEDENMTLVDDTSARHALKNQFFEKEIGRPDSYFMETDDNASDQDHLGKRSDFYDDRTVNFYLKRRGKTSRSSKFTQKRLKYNDDDSSTITGKRLLDFEVSPEKDLEIKNYLSDFYFYILFLIFITTIALSMVSSNMFYFTNMTANLFFDTPNSPSNKSDNSSGFLDFDKTLKDSNTFGDFWAFAQSTMIDMFFWDFYSSKVDPWSHTEKNDRKMLYENEILGVPRMRQVRVRNDSCNIHPNVKRFFRNCYYYYTVFSEETRPIKQGMENSSTATAWVYTKAKTLKAPYYWGDISIYGGGGYYLDFDYRKNVTIEMIKELKENNWVSRATRAVFIDFNLYNANVNLFLICKIVLEFPPVGGMLPNEDFHALKLIRYLTPGDFFILGCEFVIIFFIVYFTYKQVFAFIKQKSSFFTHWWNYVDVIILLLLYTYIILGIARYVYTQDLLSQLQANYYKYTEFATVKLIQLTFNNVIAVLVFFCWIKLFAYFNFNMRMLEFRKTLKRSLRNILGFFPMFLTMFAAFAVLAYLLFGNHVKYYNSVWSSFLALLQAFLGEFEYSVIEESNKILGPIFYIMFIFFIFFVLLNVFIAIINDAYASVKSEVTSDSPQTGMYFKRGFLNFCDWCYRRKKKKFKKKPSVRRKLIYEDIKKELLQAGFSEDEIKIFFAKYDIDIDNIVDEKKRQKVVEDLELQRIDFSENSEQFQISTLRRQIDDLNSRIEEIEMSLQPTIDKVDILLKRK